MTKLIDVSEHNGTIDWEQVAAAGYHAIIRVGYGNDETSQDDKQWARNIAEVERLGIPHGVYIYSYATDTGMAQSEAQHVLRLIAGRSLQYPVFFDSEQSGTEGAAKACAEAFGDVIEAAGYWCGVYASASWWTSNLAGLERFSKWVAAWHDESQGQAGCDIWQYTSDGTIPGISGRVDTNVVYRDFPSEIGGTVTATTTATASVDINALANDVIAGKYGDGDARKAALGANYDAVQARVNEILGATSYSVGGTYRCVVNGLNVRNAPSLSGGVVASYNAGEEVILDSWYTVADGYLWGRYTGQSGNIRYIALGSTGNPSEYLVHC
jgi:GH25 family lysozyme M1 (1,4-beta-N-acetylmuramidase)